MTDALKRFLYSADGRDYLERRYHTDGLSFRAIAEEISTYVMAVARAMNHHQIPRRNREEAQRNALEKGVAAPPPVRGPRSEAEREKTAISVGLAWDGGKFNRHEYEERGRQSWRQKTLEEKYLLSQKGLEALREQAKQKRSLLKKVIREAIQLAYPEVQFGQTRYMSGYELRLDIWIPQLRTAIEILSPADLSPIFGEADFELRRGRREITQKAVLASGGVVLRVENERRKMTKSTALKVSQSVLAQLEELARNFPPIGQRVLKLEV